jgi:hypothetical protein
MVMSRLLMIGLLMLPLPVRSEEFEVSYESCAALMPQHAEHLRRAAQTDPYGATKRFVPFRGMVRSACLTLVLDSIQGSAGIDSFTAPGDADEALERSYPGIAPRR